MNQILLYIAAGLLGFWGVAHLFPTRNVVKGFGEISIDNKRILTMEWVNEAATLIFLGLLVAAMTVAGPTGTSARVVYVLVAVMLNALSAISLATGFRVSFLPFKLCPVIFTGASILIVLGAFL